MICAEWWCFEAFILASSYIKVTELAANAITLNICATTSQIPLGLQEGICSLVGSSIGANNVALGKQIARITTMISFGCVILAALSIFILKRDIAVLFTLDDTVQTLLIATLAFYSLMYIPDSVQALLSGTIRGLGLQGKAARFVLFAYWCIGLPLGLLFAFKYDLRVLGLWYGLAIAVTVQMLFFISVILKANWQEIANQSGKVMEDFRALQKQKTVES
jgi:MATE family multidrug resistance protein